MPKQSKTSAVYVKLKPLYLISLVLGVFDMEYRCQIIWSGPLKANADSFAKMRIEMGRAGTLYGHEYLLPKMQSERGPGHIVGHEESLT